MTSNLEKQDMSIESNTTVKMGQMIDVHDITKLVVLFLGFVVLMAFLISAADLGSCHETVSMPTSTMVKHCDNGATADLQEIDGQIYMICRCPVSGEK